MHLYFAEAVDIASCIFTYDIYHNCAVIVLLWLASYLIPCLSLIPVSGKIANDEYRYNHCLKYFIVHTVVCRFNCLFGHGGYHHTEKYKNLAATCKHHRHTWYPHVSLIFKIPSSFSPGWITYDPYATEPKAHVIYGHLILWNKPIMC